MMQRKRRTRGRRNKDQREAQKTKEDFERERDERRGKKYRQNKRGNGMGGGVDEREDLQIGTIDDGQRRGLEVRVRKGFLRTDSTRGIKDEHSLQEIEEERVDVLRKHFLKGSRRLDQGHDLIEILRVLQVSKALVPRSLIRNTQPIGNHGEDIRRAVGGEERGEGDDLKDEAADGPDVDRVGVIAGFEEEFRGTIPNGDDGGGETEEGTGGVTDASKISEDESALVGIKEHVFGFDVAVHEADVVEMGDGLEELEDQVFGVGLGPLKGGLLLADHTVWGGANGVVDVALHTPDLTKVHGDVLHDDKVRRRDRGWVVVRQVLLFHDHFKALEDVGVSQSSETDDLSQHVIRKTIPCASVFEHLEGDRFASGLVEATPDDTKGALEDLLLELKVVDGTAFEGLVEESGDAAFDPWRGHCWSVKAQRSSCVDASVDGDGSA
mmetsp:Transcript_22617/g.37902  ORF Transcript_22617/g.37902 Transcript_22617/m.37902 type:complete len:439 (+) Transcript_22617:34-1350(+)